jgi:soluble lytic murein transglycosylase-like protein
MRFGILLLLTAMAASAGEFALFTNGTRLLVDRHEIQGARVKLYKDAGYIEMSADRVSSFELEEPAPVPLAPTPEPAIEATPPQHLSPTELADAAADKYGLPRTLVRSVMAAESGMQADAISPKGAVGLMQLMPETARFLGADPHDPAQNVDAGVHYLHDLLLRYNGGLRHALAAYNAGPGAVDKYHAVPPYRETIDYVFRIDNAYTKAEPQTPANGQR